MSLLLFFERGWWSQVITHTVYWFEAEDGKIFTYEMECLAYDLNVLYHRSGVRFYIDDKEVEEIIIDDDQTYNEITDILIDRNKEQENDEFYEAVKCELGWCLVEEALEGRGTHYKFNCNGREIMEV